MRINLESGAVAATGLSVRTPRHDQSGNSSGWAIGFGSPAACKHCRKRLLNLSEIVELGKTESQVCYLESPYKFHKVDLSSVGQ